MEQCLLMEQQDQEKHTQWLVSFYVYFQDQIIFVKLVVLLLDSS